MTTWHERPTLAENAKALACQAVVGLAMLTAPVFVGYGAAGTAGELAQGIGPKGVLLIQIGAGAVVAALILLAEIGIERLTRIPAQPADGDGEA